MSSSEKCTTPPILPVHSDNTPPVDDEKTEAPRTLETIRIWLGLIPALLALLAIYASLCYDHPEWILYECGVWVVVMVVVQVGLAWTEARWGVVYVD